MERASRHGELGSRSDEGRQSRATPSGPSLGARHYEEQIVGGPNAHQYWYRVRHSKNGPLVGPLKIVLNYLVIYASKHCPALTFKRWLFCRLGMKLGKNVTIASGVTLDYFFPELIEIADNTIVGMDTMILTHEFLHDRWRCGKVKIGADVLLGAQSTILPGVTVGDKVRVAAMSLVNKSVPAGTFVGGIPLRLL